MSIRGIHGEHDDPAPVPQAENIECEHCGIHGQLAEVIGAAHEECVGKFVDHEFVADHIAAAVLASGLVAPTAEVRPPGPWPHDVHISGDGLAPPSGESILQRAEHAESEVARLSQRWSDEYAKVRDARDAAYAELEAGDACGAVGCRALPARDEARAAIERVRSLITEARHNAGNSYTAQIAALSLERALDGDAS